MAVLEGGEAGLQRKAAGRKALAMGCGAVALIGALCLVGYYYWANHVPPSEPDATVLPNPNGFDACVRAVSQLPTAPRNSPLGNPYKASPAALREALAPNRPALDAVRQALRLPYVTPAAPDPTAVVPYLTQYREVCREFVAESRVAQAKGDSDQAMQRALDAIDLGSKMGRGGVMVHGLVGNACMAIGNRQAEQCVSSLTGAGATAAGQRLEVILAHATTTAEVLEGERRWSLAAWRSIVAGRTDPMQLLVGAGTGLPPPMDGPLGRVEFALYPKPWTYACVNSHYKELIRAAVGPYCRRPQVQRPAEMFTQIMSVADMEYGFQAAKTETMLRLLRVELALRAFRQRHSRQAKSLAELTPAELPLPLPDPMTGQPFCYRVRGDGYLLYSVGPDGKDDGGQAISWKNMRPDAKGDIVAGLASWAGK